MPNSIETVNTAETNSTKAVAIDGISGSGGMIATAAQAPEASAPPSDPRSIAAGQLADMLEEANAFFKDEQAKIVSRDEASARFAAYMVKLGGTYHRDPNFRLALDAECLKRDIPLAPLQGSTQYLEVVKSGKVPINEFLPVIKLVDGEWGDKVDRRGKPIKYADGTSVQVWYHNRSLEKYAPFIECCIRNDLSSEEVYEILLKGGDFNIAGVKVKATITAIIAFNAKQKGAISRTPTVWKPEVKAAAAKVPPLFSVAMTAEQHAFLLEGETPLFTPSEDGYAAAIVRFTDNGLEILGDLLLSGNPLLEKVKTRTDNMSCRNAEFLKSTSGGNS